MRYLALVIFLAACNPRTFALDYDSYYNSSSGDLTKEQLDSALQEVVKFYNDCGYDIAIAENLESADSKIYWSSVNSDRQVAVYYPYSQDIVLGDEYIWTVGADSECTGHSFDMVSALAHEIGHSQDLTHVTDLKDIMYSLALACYAPTTTSFCPNVDLPHHKRQQRVLEGGKLLL
jgi:hypothetical protein